MLVDFEISTCCLLLPIIDICFYYLNCPFANWPERTIKPSNNHHVYWTASNWPVGCNSLSLKPPIWLYYSLLFAGRSTGTQELGVQFQLNLIEITFCQIRHDIYMTGSPSRPILAARGTAENYWLPLIVLVNIKVNLVCAHIISSITGCVYWESALAVGRIYKAGTGWLYEHSKFPTRRPLISVMPKSNKSKS